MKSKLRKIVIIIFMIMYGVFIIGCKPSLEGIEIGVKGGNSKNEAYYLTEGEWVFGYISSSNARRYFSVPVTSGNKIQIRIKTFDNEIDSWMTYAGYYLYYESGELINFSGAPFTGNYIFTPNTTGKWIIGVVHPSGGIGAFAITYTNDGNSPQKPTFQ